MPCNLTGVSSFSFVSEMGRHLLDAAGMASHVKSLRLKVIVCRKYLMSKDEKKRALIGLIDILYGYAYDMRTNVSTLCKRGR